MAQAQSSCRLHSVLPFGQQVKEFLELVELLDASILIMSAQCIIWTRNLPHFSFVLTSL